MITNIFAKGPPEFLKKKLIKSLTNLIIIWKFAVPFLSKLNESPSEVMEEIISALLKSEF